MPRPQEFLCLHVRLSPRRSQQFPLCGRRGFRTTDEDLDWRKRGYLIGDWWDITQALIFFDGPSRRLKG
jgi:hypothetical protein